MTMPRCIGLMTPGWPGRNTPNGIATSVYNLALGLQSIGQTFVILTGKVDGPCPDGVPVVQIDSEDWSWMDKLRYRCGDSDIPHLLIARQIARAVQRARTETGLDVLVMEETNGWAGMVRQLTGVPVVLTLHGPWILHKTIQPAKGPRDSADRERREDRAFKSADGLISPSKNVLEAVEDAVALSNTPTVILPNSLPVSLLPQRSADLATRNILFVGRFERLKGGDTVLAAFARLCRT
jgi:glycosyltransferase involved in cell wall biosynthesis